MKRPPQRSTLFPNTTLFRTSGGAHVEPSLVDRPHRRPRAPGGGRGASPRRHAPGDQRARRTDRAAVGRLVRGEPHPTRSEEHTSELQSRQYIVCRLLLEKKK